MEMEHAELEDGEVVDEDEPIDVFETYNVLQRPHSHQQPTQAEPQIEYIYSDESDQYKESDSDTDSDSDPGARKQKKSKIAIKTSKGRDSKSDNNKYKVWCKQVQEESLAEDLITCGVTKSIYSDRHVESYDYLFGLSIEDRQKCNNSSDEDEEEPAPRLTNKRSHSDRKKVKLRLGKRENRGSEEDEHSKGSSRILSNLDVNSESSIEEVAADIAHKLSEQKDTLIKRIVEILGKDMAIKFFEETKKIEEQGGMLIMNGSRRRTPGGTYLFLVKFDDHIPQEKIRDIFSQDRKETSEKRKVIQASRRNRDSAELKKMLKNGSNKALPALLSRAELYTQELADEARLRRGKEIEQNDLGCECAVSNPPPSPVTEYNDPFAYSSEFEPRETICHRNIQEYGDDFLDLGGEVDMEVF